MTWAPTPRIHDTFTSVFPHALSFGDILMGSNEPIRFEPAEIRARLKTPAVQEYYYRAGIDIESLLAPYLDRVPRIIGPSDRPPRPDLNEDLFPRDEFGVPYRQPWSRLFEPRITADDTDRSGIILSNVAELQQRSQRSSGPGSQRVVAWRASCAGGDTRHYGPAACSLRVVRVILAEIPATRR